MLPFYSLCTIVSVFRVSPPEHVCVHHAVSARVAAARVLDLHVLVLYIGVKRLQLAQLQKVCCKQSECLQAAMKQNNKKKNHCMNNIKQRNQSYPVFILMEGVAGQTGNLGIVLYLEAKEELTHGVAEANALFSTGSPAQLIYDDQGPVANVVDYIRDLRMTNICK